MKKLLLTLLIFFMLCGNLFATADSIITVTYSKDTQVLVYDATADTADGSITATASPNFQRAWITHVKVVGGTPNPTALYDITLTNKGSDVLGGALADLGATETRDVSPHFTTQGLFGWYQFSGKLSLRVTHNNVNGAKLTVYVFIKEDTQR